MNSVRTTPVISLPLLGAIVLADGPLYQPRIARWLLEQGYTSVDPNPPPDRTAVEDDQCVGLAKLPFSPSTFWHQLL